MPSFFLKRTDAKNPDFVALVRLLDAELAVRDGEDHAFYNQFNQLNQIRQTVVAYLGDRAVGCGALKPLEADVMEVKRMFVLPEFRGRGIASQVLSELERWAIELGMRACCLETGQNQPEAIALYQKCGYQRIPNYGQYSGVYNSVCFQKRLN